MTTKQIIVEQGVDQKGCPQEFTWDIFPWDHRFENGHLSADGLPKIGIVIKKGMVVVGKSGMGVAYDPKRMPTKIEMLIGDREAIIAKYADYFYNGSFIATAEDTGCVLSARFETIDGKLCAIVELSQADAN